ncbi:sorting nexin-25 isoform X1 [Hypanus sabinus]|uniref:sorting nexin-25 isoform X1 n=1 Tax=Hypanus sabinus TaxID=79690 RepID=UPI0028C3E9E2|nr:sorting nexin-25 isoform X1 [Hypanus sabinus]
MVPRTGLLFGILIAVFFLQWDLIFLVLCIIWWAAPRWDNGAAGGGACPESPISTEDVNLAKTQVDTTDGSVQSSSLHQSLKKVFDCSYSQFILLWYNPPEDREDQLLYKVLLHEFNTAVEYIVRKIRKLNYTRIELRLIQILTIHLRSAKEEKKREKVFRTRGEEVYFLRRSAEALIHNLLPDSLWKENCYQYVIREVIALKILEKTINMVCDADFINQSLITLLDQDSLASEGKGVIASVPASTEENIKITPEGDITTMKAEKKQKKKALYRRLKNSLVKIFKKPRKKSDIEFDSNMDEVDGIHHKYGENDLNFRCSYLQLDGESGEEDDLSSNDKAFEWLKENILVPSEEQSSLRNCKITISEVSWDVMKDPLCTFDIENLEDAEECWSVKRNFQEFQELQNKAFSSLGERELPSLNGLSADTIDSEFREDFQRQLNGILKKLISDESILCNENVLNFFSPSDRDYIGLLTSLFPEEDEETDMESDISEGPWDKDLDDGDDAVGPANTSPSNVEVQDTDSAESLPSTVNNEDTDTEGSFRSLPLSPDNEDVKKYSVRHKKRSTRVSERLAEMPDGIAGHIHKLLEEIIWIEHRNLKITVVMQLVKYILPMKKKSLKKYLDHFFSIEQVTWYIDRLREGLWPDGNPVCPSPKRSDEEKASAKEKAKETLLSKVPGMFRKMFSGNEIVSNLFNVFQDTEANKRLVYTILVFLLFELIPEIKESWKGDPELCLEDLSVDALNDQAL